MNTLNNSVMTAPNWIVRAKWPSERRSLSRSATRALDVLELFGQTRRPLRAIEIARSLDLPPSTTNQLLKTMVESAHLSFDAAGKTYLPSLRLSRFGGWMVETFGGGERLRELVRNVQALSNETVTLTTPNDLFMQVVDLADRSTEDSGAERGFRISIFGSVTGAAFLSTLPDVEISRLANRARITSRDHDQLLGDIARIRYAGVADGPSVDGGHWTVAAPMPPEASPSPLILGLTGPSERVQVALDHLRTLLRSSIIESVRHIPHV